MRNKLFICFLLLFILIGCSWDKRDYQTTLNVATLKGPSAMGMIRMIDSLSNETNPSIRIEILNEPIQARKMVIDGTADFAILPTTMAAILYNRGIDYQLMAIPVWGTLYLFGNDTTIVTWDDLKEKRVNVMAKGMTPDVLFRYLLQTNGIDPDNDITLDYRFPTHIDLANAVAAGQANLAVISEPLVSMVMHRNKAVRPIFDLNEEWQKKLNVPFAQTALIAKKSLINNNSSVVKEFLSAYEFSTKWVNQNHDSAANLIAKHKILPNIEVALNAIPRSNLNFVRSKGIESQIEEYLRVFYQMNPDIIGGKIPDESFYY